MEVVAVLDLLVEMVPVLEQKRAEVVQQTVVVVLLGLLVVLVVNVVQGIVVMVHVVHLLAVQVQEEAVLLAVIAVLDYNAAADTVKHLAEHVEMIIVKTY